MRTKDNGYIFSIIVFGILLFISYVNICHAAELEVKYPTLPGGSTISGEPKLPEYLKYVFDFGMFIGFSCVFFSLIFGGVLYILSTATPQTKAVAMDWVSGAISGLVILLTCYLIVTTINPQLRFFRTEPSKDFPVPTSPTVLNPGYISSTKKLIAQIKIQQIL